LTRNHAGEEKWFSVQSRKANRPFHASLHLTATFTSRRKHPPTDWWLVVLRRLELEPIFETTLAFQFVAKMLREFLDPLQLLNQIFFDQALARMFHARWDGRSQVGQLTGFAL